MTIDAVLAAYEPSKDLRLLIGVPVSVALITGLLTGTAGIVVALLSGRRQAQLAAKAQKAQAELATQAQEAQAQLASDEQRAARQREDRERRELQRRERADVHDAIIAATLQFSNESVEQVPPPEASRMVARALSGILSRLGNGPVYYAAVGLLNEADQYASHKERMVVLGALIIHLDEWFLGQRSSAEAVTMLNEAQAASEANPQRK